MQLVRLATEIDFDGWREAARGLIASDVAPDDIEWSVGDAVSLFGLQNGTPTSNDPGLAPRCGTPAFTVPRAFVGLARTAILHSDPARFALLYRLLWRLRREPRLMAVASDADVVRARSMDQAVHREIHKTHAFVRFREMRTESGPVYVAWFEPAHHTLEAAAPFFVRRFANMRWAILTPRVTAHWDGAELTFGPGAERASAPTGDALEALWRTYYSNIFNPARLKTDTMRANMPRKYWRNLPEAELIAPLVSGAHEAMQRMVDEAPSTPKLRVPERPCNRAAADVALDTLESTREAAQHCTRCPLYSKATQTVFGEGAASASLMFVGEQPGDQEDLAGRPFVGPAGQLFDRALAAAGIDRSAAYVTNAVKHFKFEPRGKRRLHKTPGQLEIEACRPWLEHEIRLVQPRLVVTLGATAAHAVLGRPTPVQKNRGRLLRTQDDAANVLMTVHPSYLLRVPDEQKAEEYQRFVEDLKRAAEALSV